MFVNKMIDFDEFLKQLRARLERSDNPGALIFFECFLERQLPKELKRRSATDWDGHTVNAGDFDVVYPMAANILHSAATGVASENITNVYHEASAVSKAMCDEINEIFECSGAEMFDFLQIKSYTDMMVEAGLVKTASGLDGQRIVSLTEKGERVALEVERELDRVQE